ncbi:uncharacterized protein LOC121737430 [Aricia agestis]|uniref:uncharacterized protein LOC121737430 n=1 Tax=Aricia agestis TaxID=91739 RepID=UPI001C205169|nr:uncharacterized protein LOC121737430 [Aricia agestis]
MVATKSSNLKGTYVRYLKDSVATIKIVFDEVKNRSSTEEIRRLEAQNARLEGQLAILRQELNELRRQTSQPTGNDVRELLAEVSRANVETFGNMLNARLAGLEDRLLPEPRRRPLLVADNAAAASVEAPLVEGGLSKAKNKPLTRNRKKATMEAAGPSQASTASVPLKEGGKKRKKRGKKSLRCCRAAKRAAPKKKKKRKLRPSKIAAITLTMEKGVDQSRVSYASILEEAKSRIDFEEAGICQRNKVRFRLARTGARILDVTGEDAQQKADALANRMRDVLDRDVVRIGRPVKRAKLLVSGMDDAATAADVIKAAAKEGGCPAIDIRSGRITVGPRGARSLWLHIPTVAAKKLMDSGRLQVGWVMTKVVLLAARPTRCYRCLDTGHLASNCQSPVDRSGNCFRCGKSGHKAGDCAEEPRCFFCAELGKESNHVLGTNGCSTTEEEAQGSLQGSAA